MLHRILGNDLPPRHEPGQTYRNCRFILDNEPELAGCDKRWIVNRIFDEAAHRRVVDLLDERGQRYIDLPFDIEEYARAARMIRPPEESWDRHWILDEDGARRHSKILYAINNNGARNVALDDGRAAGDWALPFDGNCVFDTAGWSALTAELATQRHHVFAVPMYRLASNDDYATFDPAGRRPHEPQLAFSAATTCRFDEDFRWGLNPKVEMIERLGLTFEVNDESLEVEADRTAGHVMRLFSGVVEGETRVKQRRRLRNRAIDEALDRLDEWAANREPGRS